jgi:hypothetical protein
VYKIITHPGQAHNDDILSVAFAFTLEKLSEEIPVFRRNPTVKELNDPECLVLDIGGHHDPKLNNYDHHQLPPAQPPTCACSLFLESRHPHFLAALRKYTPWYNAMEYIDSKGPYQWAANAGLPFFPSGLSGALDEPLKSWFARYAGTEKVGIDLIRALMQLGYEHYKYIKTITNALADIRKKARIISVNGVQGIVYNSSDPTGLAEYRAEVEVENIGFSVTLDDRGPGTCLYRFSDHPKVDFRRLAGHREVSFIHSGGFIAKTSTKLLKDHDIEQLLLDLLSQAIG